jgi:hypothetical protein
MVTRCAAVLIAKEHFTVDQRTISPNAVRNERLVSGAHLARV